MASELYDKYIGQTFGDRYEIIEKIGEGGMAVVYKGFDHRLNREVAVKIMREELAKEEEFKSRFIAESHAVAMLSHPNIVAVYDVSHNDEIDYIVMELIDGITLRQYMEKKGRIVWKEALHFSKQVANALSHAHERGIIHRDIKPQNIMLLRDGSIKVADFGIAALENEVEDENRQAIGSLNYLAPELLHGEAADAKTDIYALGVMMYEMLCARKPYIGETPSELAIKQTSGPEPIVNFAEDVPEDFQEIVCRAFQTDPLQRYQSADELQQALDDFTVKYLKAEGKYKGNPLEVEVKPNIDVPGKEYIKSIRRSNSISFSLGTFALLAATVAFFVLLWNYWLADIFSPAQRMTLPDFTGHRYEDLAGDSQMAGKYNFKVNYVVDTTKDSGIIISQEPEAGRSLMITSKGIDVKLSVATGYVLADVPDVSGLDYREAVLKLTNAGFVAEVTNVKSDSVKKDTVISTSPGAGEQISAGSTVYVDVSSGTQITYVKMPNIIGLTEDAAIAKLESRNLSFSTIVRESSEYDAGTVIAQSVMAFAEVEEHSQIVITVSTGP